MSRYSQTELKTAIEAIDAKLQAGVKSVTAGDTSTTVDLAELRRERDTLVRQLASSRDSNPSMFRVDLSGG